MTNTNTSPRTLLISTADWDAPLWTNKQHVASAIAKHGHVEYWNSLGLRNPRLTASDLKRILARLGNVSVPAEGQPVPDGMTVISPKVLPFHTNVAARWVNGQLLRRQARNWAQSSEPKVFWTYNPVTYGLERYADRAVYHCVDFLGEVEGVDRGLIAREEERLARDKRIIGIATSRAIELHLRKVGFVTVLYWPNVAEVETYMAVESAAAPRSGFVFAGNLTTTKVNFSALRTLAQSTGETVHIAGATGIDGTTMAPEIDDLFSLENVRYHGTLTRPELAELFAQCRVGLIPYLENGYTRGVFPMKVYEYLAAGLDVVATGLPSLRDVPGVALVEENLFTNHVLHCPPLTTVRADENREYASENSWTRRAEEIHSLLSLDVPR